MKAPLMAISCLEPLEPRLHFSAIAPPLPITPPLQPTTQYTLPSQPQQTTLQSDYLRAVEAVKQQYHIPGVVVGITAANGSTQQAALGFSNVATKTPLSVNEYFPIRSVTKSFTVTLILQLARAHELSLSDPISKYFPGIPSGNQITLEQLAAMESGIKSYTAVTKFLEDFIPNLQRSWTPQELIDYAIPESPIFTPGAQYDYSNTNTILLGIVAQKVTHLPLAQALQKFIFTPLGLNHTFYENALNYPTPHPTGYEVDPKTGALTALPTVNFSAFGAAGAMVTTLSDLLKWGKALGTGTLIGPKLQALRESHSRPATDGPEYDRYGLGIGQLDGWWGHTGEGLGFQAATFYDPSTRTTIAVLVNSSQPINVATQIFKALAKIIDQPPCAAVAPTFSTTPIRFIVSSSDSDQLLESAKSAEIL